MASVVGTARPTVVVGSMDSLATVCDEASDFFSLSFFISSTSDLNTRAERPRLRAASGSFFQPKIR